MSSEDHDPRVDALVREYLERQAEKVEANDMLRAVQARLDQPATIPLRTRRRWRGLVAAAAVVLCAVGIWSLVGGHASAEDMVRRAQEVHAQAVDRCYRVQAEVQGTRFDNLPIWQNETRLWTRGNEFWIESVSGARNLAWGQDRQGRVWVARGRQRGMRLEADRVPEPIAFACAIRGLQIEKLLGEVLADFDLQWDESASIDPGIKRVRATPRADRPHPTLRGVTLEIDEKTRVIQRAVVVHEYPGHIRATATFSLIETRPQPDDAYQLEGHLDKDAPIVDSLPALLRPRRNAP
jgi:hypothetical protein